MLAVEAPSVESARGGLLPVANVITGADPIFTLKGVKYEGRLSAVPRPIPTDGSDKQFDQVPVLTGDPFTVYQGIEFSLFERTRTENEAKTAFGGGETVAVERALQSLILEPQAVDITPTPGTPVTKLKWAVGALEQWIGERYNGLPLIHANRLGTSLMEELPSPSSDWKIHTHQGTPVANGSGYANTGAPAGATWLYVTGQVNLWKGEENYYESPNLKENRNYGLVEATYVPTVEGFVAKILVGI